MKEDLNKFPPRQTVPGDGKWRTTGESNGYKVQLECGGECRIRIVNSDGSTIWEGLHWAAQRLAGHLNQAAIIKIEDGQ